MARLTVSFRGHFIGVYDIDREEVMLGRDPECNIIIDSLAVAPQHARIQLRGNAYQIALLDDNLSLLVNHEEVSSARLEHGDVLQIGKHTLTFSETAPKVEFVSDPNIPGAEPADAGEQKSENSSAPSSRGQGHLQILTGNHSGRTLRLHHTLTRLGKTGSDCAVIARRDDGYYLSHLEGKRFPMVDDQPIGEQSYLLEDGNIIQVGKTRMQFCRKTKEN